MFTRHQGLNDRILLFHPHPDLLAFIDRIIHAYETSHKSFVDDQRQLNVVLLEDKDFASHFYEVPKVWFKAYQHDEGARHDPRLQVHLVNRLK